MLQSSRDCHIYINSMIYKRMYQIHGTCSVEAVCFASAGLQRLLGWPYSPTTNPS